MFAGEKKPLLSFLPSDNKNINLVDFSNIQNICTSLEFEYNLKLYTLQKDDSANELKKVLIDVVKQFRKNDLSLDKKLYDNAVRTIEHLSLPLSTKIWLLYQRYKTQIDKICKKYSHLGINELTEECIINFVKLRNGITHNGQANWGNSGNIYRILQCLVYFAIFERIGFATDEVFEAIHQFA